MTPEVGEMTGNKSVNLVWTHMDLCIRVPGRRIWSGVLESKGPQFELE